MRSSIEVLSFGKVCLFDTLIWEAAMIYEPYHYKECGLDNVLIEGISPKKDISGEVVYTISNLPGLHRAISAAIVYNSAGMSGKELRFLRTELGLTQDELARVLHKEALTVSRWERSECPIDPNAETVIRFLAIEKLKLGKIKDVTKISHMSVSTAQSSVIRIDGSNPENYKPLKKRAA